LEDGRLVGSLIVGWDGWRCHLYRLAVEPSVRRRGVATALLAAAGDRARQLGAVRLDATVHPDNAPAIAYWQAMGFTLDVYGRWSRPL
jgi:ribosomal protein S18 acetylase RimI-like enzyme